ncbi:MAG: hypothetical protein Q9M92_10630 [Enterobacterales bacterium]|nr:hypothetical protein [Enterobacterales bacterium]
MNHSKPHWSFWLIAILGILWNLMGSVNFVMQMNAETLSNYPEAAQSLINSRPLWATVAFAIAVLIGLFGAVFLVLKKTICLCLFKISLIAIVVTNIHTLNVEASAEIWMGSFMSLIVALFFIFYSKMAHNKHWFD